MSERKFVVVLTDGQSVKYTAVDPTLDAFTIARKEIGCDWIEIIEPSADACAGYVFLADEEAKLKGLTYVNCIASYLYESHIHGDPIVGHVVIVKPNDAELDLLTADEASTLTFRLTSIRDEAITHMKQALHIK